MGKNLECLRSHEMGEGRVPVEGIAIDSVGTDDPEQLIEVVRVGEGLLQVSIHIPDISAIAADPAVEARVRQQVATRYTDSHYPEHMTSGKIVRENTYREGRVLPSLTIRFTVDTQSREVSEITMFASMARCTAVLDYRRVEQELLGERDQVTAGVTEASIVADALYRRRTKQEEVRYETTSIWPMGDEGKELYPQAAHIVREVMTAAGEMAAELGLAWGIPLLFRNYLQSPETLAELGFDADWVNTVLYSPEFRGHERTGVASARITAPLRELASWVNIQTTLAFLYGKASPYSLEDLVYLGKVMSEHQRQENEERKRLQVEKREEVFVQMITDRRVGTELTDRQLIKILKIADGRDLFTEQLLERARERVSASRMSVALAWLVIGLQHTDSEWAALKELAYTRFMEDHQAMGDLFAQLVDGGVIQSVSLGRGEYELRVQLPNGDMLTAGWDGSQNAEGKFAARKKILAGLRELQVLWFQLAKGRSD